MAWRYCNNCSTEVFPTEEIRSKSTLTVPDGTIEEPSISYTPEPTLVMKKVEYKGGVAQLAKRSTLKILDYTETSGSG